MKVLLLGSTGQVGRVCGQALIDAGYDVVLFTREDMDFAFPKLIEEKVLSILPNFIVNACAYTDVDKAEEEPLIADLVNNQSVDKLAYICKQLGIPLIHLSTDYVFDGFSVEPYIEADACSPLGIYGVTKLAGELAIQKNMHQFILLRTGWVFGEYGENFVKTILKLGAERSYLRVVNDQLGSPVYVGDIVTVILFFVNEYQKNSCLPWGVYHCSSQGQTSWFNFAIEIFRVAYDLDLISNSPKVTGIPTSEYPTLAPRPAYSVLATNKLERLMGSPLPHWQEGLSKLLSNQLLNPIKRD